MSPWSAGLLGYILGRSSGRRDESESDFEEGCRATAVTVGLMVVFAAIDGLAMALFRVDDLFATKWGGWLVACQGVAAFLIWVHLVVGRGISDTIFVLGCMGAIAIGIFAGLKWFGVAVAVVLGCQWLLPRLFRGARSPRALLERVKGTVGPISFAETPSSAPVASIGFWCMPIGSHSFIKLPIKAQYTLQGETVKPVLDGNQINAAWAIVANATQLAPYFPWIVELLREVGVTYGWDIFTGHANPVAQSLALNGILGKTAFENQWAYVIEQGSDTVLLGCQGHVTFVDTLYAELSGTLFQRPENIRLSRPVKYVVICDHRGNRQPPQTLEEQFCATC